MVCEKYTVKNKNHTIVCKKYTIVYENHTIVSVRKVVKSEKLPVGSFSDMKKYNVLQVLVHMF